MVRNDSDAATLTGNDRFQGFNVDVISALSSMLNFRYELYVVNDDQSTSALDKVVQELTEGVSMFIDSRINSFHMSILAESCQITSWLWFNAVSC